MRVHAIRHVPVEGPGVIADWANSRGCLLTEGFALTESYPSPDEVDLVVVLGGSMDADDHDASPWLETEKRFIADLIRAKRPVLGICLGAQIVAEVIGGTVRRGAAPEIGFYPLRRLAAADAHPVFAGIPDGLVAGHWHNDTFDLPEGVPAAFSTDLTPNQAFALDNGRVVGLQFHLEWTDYSLSVMLAEFADDVARGGAHVMTPARIRESAHHLTACHDALFSVLDAMAELRFA